jgi:hypothetical protein
VPAIGDGADAPARYTADGDKFSPCEVHAMIRAAFVFVSILIFSPFAHGLGTDYAPGPIEGSSAWPKNTLALVNSGERVGGFWVNQSDSLFYRGDAAALNEFIKQYSRIDDTPLKVILHAGAKPLTGRLAEKPTVPFNWALQVNLRGWGAPKDPRLEDSNGYGLATISRSTPYMCHLT